jgi:putative molybdopterin biosynthesis protein
MQRFLRFELATTEEGWLLAPGNPLGLRGAPDLARTKARLANRPAGSGARRLLDLKLREARLDPRRVAGYERELRGQLDAGRAIAQGFADAAIGTASSARLFALDFVPLSEERCTLFVPRRSAATPEVRALLDALRSTAYRRDLEALDAYDATRTGELIA